MVTVLILMVAGILIGLFVERISFVLKYIDKTISLTIYLLLFLLGISVGINDKIIKNLDTIGVEALVITLGAVAGSVLMAWTVYRLFFKIKPIHIDEK